MEDSTITYSRISTEYPIQEGIVATEEGVNDRCHNYTGGVKAHSSRIIPNPRIALILWGN